MKQSPTYRLEDCLATLAECEPNLAGIQRQLRLARSKLGAAIEQLEQCEPSPGDLEQLQCGAAAVAGEVDSLLTTLDDVRC